MTVMDNQQAMTVTATVPPACSVSATGMDFGSKSSLASAILATSNITVTCSSAVTVTVALAYGQMGTSAANRVMRSGGNQIIYGIYRDAARTQPWGNTPGTDTVSVSGTSVSVAAYGSTAASRRLRRGATRMW